MSASTWQARFLASLTKNGENLTDRNAEPLHQHLLNRFGLDLLPTN